MQPSLFDTLESLESRVISRRADFDQLFEGFSELRAVSYVASPQVLLDVLSDHGFKHLELVLGDTLAPLSREALAAAGVDLIERLADLTGAGRLRVLLPPRTIHSKLYLLRHEQRHRVIISSANLTVTAREASRQTNYAWYADLRHDHPWLARVVRDYEAHARGCDLFLGDLLDLIRRESTTPRRQVIEAWLTGAAQTDPAAEASKLIGEIADWAVDPARRDQPVFTVRLPEAPAVRKHAERLLGRIGGTASPNGYHVDRSAFFTHVEQSLPVPLMRIDAARKSVRFAAAGGSSEVAVQPGDPPDVDRALAHLERYVETVEWGDAPDPLYAQTAMYEAALYMLAAPFANEQMQVLRRRYGALERRGPRILYLVGPSSNGKTTFLTFALFLLAGRHIRPLAASDLTKRRLLHAMALGTSFPLVFDDVNPGQRSGFEEIVKSYWESWWMPDGISPQLVISSNSQSLKEWAKSRFKRIDFDVHFAASERNTERLARLFDDPSRLFGWFAHVYLDQLSRLEEPRDDDLFLARDVMQTLYRHARRSLPPYFPLEPLENRYDPARRSWLDLLDRLRQATVRRDGDRVTIDFADDLQHYEIQRYMALLPQTVKVERRGKKLVIDNPAEFERWLGRSTRQAWWKFRGR